MGFENDIKAILSRYAYVEDGEVKVNSGFKYDVYNYILRKDRKFILKLFKDYDVIDYGDGRKDGSFKN